ncbi:MAG: hypothetical protein ACRDNJ_11070 [Solirubrobacteraceae bacterium]
MAAVLELRKGGRSPQAQLDATQAAIEPLNVLGEGMAEGDDLRAADAVRGGVMALRLVGPTPEPEAFALIEGEHPTEAARRALYAAAEAEGRDWAAIILRFADASIYLRQ